MIKEVDPAVRAYLASIGKKGGAATTTKKKKSSARNGKMGGRPRKKPDLTT